MKRIKRKRKVKRRTVVSSRGRSLDVLQSGKFHDGDLISAKSLNRIVYAIRALRRMVEEGRP